MTEPIDQVATDAVIKWLRSRSIGVVNGKSVVGTFPDGRRGDEEQPGSASTIKWGKHHCIMTAKHVVEGAEKNDLRFFFSDADSDYMSREESLKRDYIEVDTGHKADIHEMLLCDWEDIAVLTVDPASAPNAQFYDFNSGWTDPGDGEPIYCLGFPRHNPITVQVERTQERERHLLGLVPMVWTSVVIPKPDSLIEHYATEIPYDPNRHFLIDWTVEDKTLGMKGFSGAATWTDPAEEKLWTPKLSLTGMATHYYPDIKVGRMTKASVLKEFLEEALGPA